MITIVNPSTEALLATSRDDLLGAPIDLVLPEVAPLVEEMQPWTAAPDAAADPYLAQGQGAHDQRPRDQRAGPQRRARPRRSPSTTSPISCSAQRTSAWADVARRIAHEIKNPADADPALGRAHPPQVRQGDHHRPRGVRSMHGHHRPAGRRHQAHGRRVLVLRPHAEADDRQRGSRRDDPAGGLHDADRASRDRVRRSDPADGPLVAPFDRRLVSQAVTNIVKNATEAIAAVPEIGARAGRRSSVLLDDTHPDYVIFAVTDNGKGFPVERTAAPAGALYDDPRRRHRPGACRSSQRFSKTMGAAWSLSTIPMDGADRFACGSRRRSKLHRKRRHRPLPAETTRAGQAYER